MKIKLACIAMIVFGCNFISAQNSRIEKILKKYKTCDTASFIRTRFSKAPEKQIMGHNSYAMTLCRKDKGEVWYAYDIQTLDSSLLDLSFFNSREKKIYLADSNNLYQVVNHYKFETYMAPPYIWDIWYFPWDKSFITNFYKRIKQTNEFDVYSSMLGKNKIYLYVNTDIDLIEKIVHVQTNGSYDSVIFHYNYFKNPTTEYISKSPDHPYFPVNNKNDSIVLAKKKWELKQKHWNDRVILKDSVLSKIINGKFDYYLIDFWHLTCHPCKVNLKILDTALKQLKNVEVVLINVHDNDEEANTYLTNYGLPFRNICDYDHSIEGYFKPQFYPTTILLDNSGKVVYRYDGMDRDIGNQIRAVIQSLK
jgi:thiol-disulfide isomerase/thioredoxin